MTGSFVSPPGIGIDHLLRQGVWRTPGKVALIDDQDSITYRAAEAASNRLARWLAANGVAAGHRVALILPNGIPFIVAELAILRLAAVKVPLNIRFAVPEVLYALADCAPTALIATPDYAARVQAERAHVPSLGAVVMVGGATPGCADYESIIASGDAAPLTAVPYRDDAPILIRYTGGTTGRPKGVVHTHRSYLAVVLDVVRENALVEADIALHLGHLSHGLNFMWPAWYLLGSTQVLRERFDPVATWTDFVRYEVTWVYMVPTMIHMLLEADDGRADVSTLRCFTYASAPMPVLLLRRAIARFGNIFTQVYTLSEAPVITTMMRPHEHLETDTECGPRLGSVGREVPTFELRLVDDAGRDVAPGTVGEIAVRSVNNMTGYWNLPEETARTLADGWLRTGDMARRASDGFLHLADRKKDIVITGGFNVWPKEVEDALLAHPDVAQAAVVGAPDEKWGEIIVAYIVAKPGRAPTSEMLASHCLELLADYKKPRRVHLVEALPLTPVGKVFRAALRERARGGG
ncbi:MAG: long-chain fatty acid--CoA ligase [Alphaproteobacteria bacterium]|nr:long-chain fatty acid--CoA ligase [Alphaproteobacteria bacterium]